jgi:hypothetical protein
LQSDGAGSDLDGLRGRADRERDVDGQVTSGIEFVVTGGVALEAGGLDGNSVESCGNVGDGEVAGLVGGDGALDARLIADGDLGIGNDGARGIFDEAGNGAEIGLRESRLCGGETGKKQEQYY